MVLNFAESTQDSLDMRPEVPLNIRNIGKKGVTDTASGGF